MNDTERIERIEKLKRRRRALVLVHNYQPGEIHRIADIAGDSLELAREAARADADVIVFCGVHFMAETAAILAPDKIVLAPRPEAGCPMADMADGDGVARLKAEHPGAAAICYVNSTAAVKAQCDLCCTSANAERVVASVDPSREVIFVPDQFLGDFVERRSGRRLVRWPGYCPVHARIRAADIERARAQFPRAELWAHPECRPEVAEVVDFVLSTGGMVRRARETDAAVVVVGTEVGMLYRLRAERPDVTFLPATEQAICVDMKLTRLEDVERSLERMETVIRVPEPTRGRAAAALERMLELS